MEDIPHINVLVDPKNVSIGTLTILEKIRPNWPTETIDFKFLTDGLTNILLKCLPKHGFLDSQAILVRIYGNNTELLIDREAEIRNLVLLNRKKIAPQIFATFTNGLAYEYVPGNTLTTQTITDPYIYKLVAKNMAKLHKIKMPATEIVEPFVWRKMKPFLDLIPESFSDDVKNQRYKKMLPPKHEIEAELNLLRSKIEKLDIPVVFCHNDLLLGNIIYTEDKKSTTFIDYEYAAMNYQAFDIGNHFAEFVGCDLDDMDYTRCPNKEVQMDWLTAYLTEFFDRTPTIKEVEKLYEDCNKCALLALIFWALWGLIQAEHSHIDYDFLRYASIRMTEYFRRKDEFLLLD